MASSELVSMQNATAKAEMAKADKTKTNNSEVTSDMFLKLMLEQLQYQDPLDPVSNTEFLSQQAMFTQLEKIMDIDSEVSSSNAIQQTLSLVGKEVTITDPDNKDKTITGVVESANFTTDEPTITIGGKDYPLDLVQNVSPAKDNSAQVNQNTEAIQSIEKTLGDLNINFSGLSEAVKGFLSSEKYSG